MTEKDQRGWRAAVAALTVRQAAGLALGVGFLLFWFGGLWSYMVWGGPPERTAWAAPFFLLLAAVAALAGAGGREAWRLALAGLIGFAAELAGTRTGFPFGGYRYTEALGPQVGSVPLVLACAWVVVFAHARQVVRIVPRAVARLLLTAAWLVGLDLVIDPLAAGPLDYWSWTETGFWHGVPWTNFAGWAFVGLVLAATAPAAAPPRPWTRRVGLGVLLFFTILAAAHRLHYATLAGTVLVAVDLLLGRTARTSPAP